MTDADPEFDVEIRDGKTYARVVDLEEWDENPREAEDGDLDRLEKMLERLGQFKPLLALEDGTVIAGNMRLRTMREMEWDEAWVEVVHPDDEDQLVEFALADNDRVGRYDEGQVADLLGNYSIDITMFKPDFYSPTDLAQNVATVMGPEQLLEMSGHGESEEEAPSAEEAEERGNSEEAAPKPRSLENIGSQSATVQVQLFMTKSEKDEMMDGVERLKKEYGVQTTSDVCSRAVAAEVARFEEDPAEIGPGDPE